MALDISSGRTSNQTLTSASSPSPSESSSPSSPNNGSLDSQAVNAALYLKAVSEGTSRMFAQQQALHVCHSSPSSSILDSPRESPLQESLSRHSHSLQSLSTHRAMQLQSSIRTLKFSIENILSPEFGKNGKNPKEYRKSAVANGEKSKRREEIHHKRSHPLDVSSLTNKRKHSSDSESSSISSLSSASKDIINSHTTSKDSNGRSETSSPTKDKQNMMWPAWVYCTRYSDRPSSGPRSRKIKKKEKKADEKRPRTAFTAEQLARLKQEFQENRYLTEKRRQDLARDLKLNESQIKIWFQNKRAKIKKSTGNRNPLALHLMAQGLYNHSTMSIDGEDDDDNDFDDRDSSCTSPPEQSDVKNKIS